MNAKSGIAGGPAQDQPDWVRSSRAKRLLVQRLAAASPTVAQRRLAPGHQFSERTRQATQLLTTALPGHRGAPFHVRVSAPGSEGEVYESDEPVWDESGVERVR
jgi:hypothetical protein